MTNIRKLVVPASAAILMMVLGAGSATLAADDVAAAILARLQAARPDLEYGTPQPSSMSGLYAVQVVDGPLLYVSEDGARFIAGDLFEVQGAGQGFSNLAEVARQQERKQLIAEVKPEDMIIFAPPEPKATLTVFTDVDCGYCRKLHNEIPERNRLGIAVHYLAFPRQGLSSPSYRKIATAWCATDRQQTLTRLKNGEKVPDNVCTPNPVAAQMLLGERVGVSGTPALVLEDGTLISGYRPAKELAHLVGIN